MRVCVARSYDGARVCMLQDRCVTTTNVMSDTFVAWIVDVMVGHEREGEGPEGGSPGNEGSPGRPLQRRRSSIRAVELILEDSLGKLRHPSLGCGEASRCDEGVRTGDNGGLEAPAKCRVLAHTVEMCDV